MRQFQWQVATICFLTIVFCSYPKSSAAGKSSVEIVNWDLGEPLWINCSSKDDKLGWRELAVKQSFKFEFHQNVWMTTQFDCWFLWHGGKNWQRHTVWHRSTMNTARDMPARCGNCLWRAELDGTWLWSGLNQNFVFGHQWYTNGTWKFPPV